MADISKFSAVRDGVRGQFTLNKMHTTTGDFFRIDVAHMLPCVPKDVVSLNIHTFIESAPNPYPINGSMKYGLYAFFVPYRLLWEEWSNYIADLNDQVSQPYFTLYDLWRVFNPDDSGVQNPWILFRQDAINFISNIRNLSAIVPFLNMSADEFGALSESWINRKFNAYALRAINKIWWDWFRDKAHISDAAESSYVKINGGHIDIEELVQLCAPKYRCYPKNYITTAFSQPQEGGASVAPVKLAGNDLNPNFPNATTQKNITYGRAGDVSVVAGSNVADPVLNDTIGQFDMTLLKLKNSVQNYRERLLVAGKTRLSRLLALFDTAPTIEELRMTNCLGGHEENFVFKNNLAPSSTANRSDGSLSESSAFGYNPRVQSISGQKSMNAVSPDNGFGLENITYKTDETGFLVVLGCITPVVQYYQALPRDWFRGTSTFAKDRSDYFHSDFENQPLQVMENIEVLCSKDVEPDGVYGFNQNYIDYKLEFDTIAGDFVSNESSKNILKNMHLGRDLEATINETDNPAEALNPEYLTQSDGLDKLYFDQKFTMAGSEGVEPDHFIINHKIEVLANRPMMEVTLPSLDSAISQSAKKKLVETGGFRY